MKRAIEASSGQVLIEIAARYFRSTEVASLVGERAMPGRSD
jgi:GDP-D-mannose dehydratase